MVFRLDLFFIHKQNLEVLKQILDGFTKKIERKDGMCIFLLRTGSTESLISV